MKSPDQAIGNALAHVSSRMRRAADQVKITSISEVPPYRNVIQTGDRTSRFQAAESSRSEIAILAVNDKDVYLVLADPMQPHNFHSWTERIQHAGFNILTIYRADGGLISSFYQKSRPDAISNDSDPAILTALDRLVEEAMRKGVSDIHIEKRDQSACVKMRELGELVVHMDGWSVEYCGKFFRAIHAAADDDSKETTFAENESQQMSVTRVIDRQRVKLRVQTLTAYPDGGMDMVMRVLKMGVASSAGDISTLGYEEHHIDMLEHMMSSPSGVILIAGTTGSGKSTTIMNMMGSIRDQNPGIKMYSIEDPPEYILRGVTQIPVTRRKGDPSNPFARSMRDAMRADLDVIMVGEIRDHESGKCLVSMVQSGHKVLTTIHAASGLAIIERLEKMEVDLQTMASRGFISGLIFQTLVPRLCDHCKTPWDKGDHGKRGLGDRIASAVRVLEGDDGQIFFRGKGCSRCGGRGITSRTVCAEMIIPDHGMLKAFRDADFGLAYDLWRGQRLQREREGRRNMAGRTALDHGMIKMLQGQLSPLDVESALGLINVQEDEVFA